MDGRIGPLSILPSQMLMLNPLLVIILVPIFETFVFPFMAKFNCLLKPLRRMGWGGFFIATSFVLAAFVQIFVSDTYRDPPNVNQMFFYVQNDAACNLELFSNVTDESVIVNSLDRYSGNLDQNLKYRYLNCSQTDANTEIPVIKTMMSGTQRGLFVKFTDNFIFTTRFNVSKTTRGRSYIFIDNQNTENFSSQSIIVQIVDLSGNVLTSAKVKSNESITLPVDPPIWDIDNKYEFVVQSCPNTTYINCSIVYKSPYKLLSGETHLFAILSAEKNESYRTDDEFIFVKTIPGNNIGIMWQLPQFILITIGEIMFCVTGLEFSYSQASHRLKSVVLALWYVNNAFGDMVPTVISFGEVFRNPTTEFFMYAIMVYIATLVFALVASRYEYVEQSSTMKEKMELDEQNDRNVVSTL